MTDQSSATLQLLQATSAASTAAQRRFILLNSSRDIWSYQMSALWREGSIEGHSGVGQIEPQGPYAQWLNRLFQACTDRAPGAISAEDIGGEVAQEWSQWWPPYALWLPLTTGATGVVDSGLLLARDLPWQAKEMGELSTWSSLWSQLDTARQAAQSSKRSLSWHAWRQAWRDHPQQQKRRLWKVLAAVVAVCLLPVHLTVRAPGELVPRDPVVLRAGMDGMVRSFKVEPNQVVKAGQVLAELDDAGWASRLQVAQQALLTAEAEWRQTSQLALNDVKAKGQLAAAQGKYEERRSEVAYLNQQVKRTTVLAPHDGVVLIQDPGSWPGRTVSAGEPLMKLARPRDQEVEAWLAVGDAIDLPTNAAMHLHLSSRPGSPVSATLRSYSYEAEHRPDMGLGYRLRGTLEGEATERLGSRGTVRIDGPWVPLSYWVMRRPLAAAREALGW